MRRLPGGLFERMRHEPDPRVVRREARRGEDAAILGHDPHAFEAMGIEMAAQGGQDIGGIGADDIAQLAGRAGPRRYRVDRRVGHTAGHREDRETVPAKGAFRRGQAFLAPVFVDGGSLSACDGKPAQGRAHLAGQTVGPPFGHADLTARIGDRRQSLHEDHGRIGQ